MFRQWKTTPKNPFTLHTVRSVLLIGVGNEHGDTSSKPWRRLFVFHVVLIPLGKVWIQLFFKGKYLGNLGYLSFLWQLIYMKTNSEFKSLELHLKLTLCHILFVLRGRWIYKPHTIISDRLSQIFSTRVWWTYLTSEHRDKYRMIKVLYKVSIILSLTHRPFPTADALIVNTSFNIAVVYCIFRRSTYTACIGLNQNFVALSTGAAEYTDSISAERKDFPKECRGYETMQSNGEAPECWVPFYCYSFFFVFWGGEVTLV